MIYLYYSDSKEKDLVEGWAKYGTKMGFKTYLSSDDWHIASTGCSSNVLQDCTSTDTCSKNVSYDTIYTTSNPGKLTIDYSNTNIVQDDTSSLYPWNYVKCDNPWKSNYIVDPLQLETKHRKVKQIIKFKPI